MPSLYGPSLLWAELTRYLSDLSIFYKKNVPVEKLVMQNLIFDSIVRQTRLTQFYQYSFVQYN